jgi:Flp pilus assembly protein TadG
MLRRFRILARLLRGNEGVSALEFGLLAPILAILIIGIVDFGVAIWQDMQVANAAEAGAAYASVNGWNATASQIETAVTSATSLSTITAAPAPWVMSCGCPNANSTGITEVACGTTCADGSQAGHYWVVNAQASYAMFLSYPGIGNPMTLSATAYARLYP